MEKNRTPVKEEKYEEYTAQSHFIKMWSSIRCLVILHRGIIGWPLSQYSGNLKPRTFVCLDDTTLAKQYCGFEQSMLFAELGRALHCERGYHFFSSIPHLCVITGEFHPLDLTHVITLIAIPDPLVDDTTKLDSQSILTQLTRWSHRTSPSYILLFANGRRIRSGSILSGIRLSSGWEGKADLPQVWSEFLSKV